ncbi:MAG TPA: c-type cytochrome biogenesis protein CcmI [Burkholderiaceae bacterium]|nr:c-type cytochrome biogenesis protein CcmI [Burkholderiaceae bacterium]
MTDPISELRDQLQQLDARHARGELGKKAYETERARIERALLDRVLAQPGQAAAVVARPSRTLVAGLALGVVALAIAGYAWTGSPSLIAGVPPAQPAGHEMDSTQFAAAVERLAEKLKEQPDNVEGWVMLARSYVQLGRFSDAVPAFAKAVSLAGEDAGLLADWADALAVMQNRDLSGEPAKLIERALKADPNSFKALALAGTASFNAKDYRGAVKHWEKLAQVAPPDSPFAAQLQSSIAEARQLGGMAAAPAGAAAKPAAAADAGGGGAAAAPGGVTLRGTIRLAPALAKLAKPDDTVFVFARPAEGSRMPLAILRKQVKDLPIEFAFDDSMAMTPGTKLSAFPKVIVDARVSKSGQAQAAAGDLIGQSGSIAHDARGVVVEIGSVAK